MRIQAAHRNVHQAQAYLTKRGITEASTTRFRLGCENGRLTIPYLSPAGPWIVKTRCIHNHDCKDEGHAKYMLDVGSELHLFNAAALLDADLVVVTEGELDAITVTQLDIPAVAYPGTQMWKSHPHWRWCFDSTSEVVVVADGDEPGRKAAAVVADSLRGSVAADIRVVNLPDGYDSNSYITDNGDADYLDRLDLL